MPGSPTVRRRRLRIELRRLRQEAGLTGEHVAGELGWSAAKISRLENGTGYVQPVDVAALCDLYGASNDLKDLLKRFAAESKKRDWWQSSSYRSAIPSWFGVYVGLEGTSSYLRTYEAEYVPGLFQTADYIREVYRTSRDSRSPEEIDQQVAVRLARQQILTRTEEPPELWAIIGESVLRRRIGSSELMKAQLEHIAETSRLPNVTVQVLPFSVGVHPGMNGPFVILSFPEDSDTDVVYLENMVGSLYVEDSTDVRRYAAAFDHLRANAADPGTSTKMILSASKEMN